MSRLVVDASRRVAHGLFADEYGGLLAVVPFDGPFELVRDVADRFGCTAAELSDDVRDVAATLSDGTPVYHVYGPPDHVLTLLANYGAWLTPPPDARPPIGLLLAVGDATAAVAQDPDRDPDATD